MVGRPDARSRGFHPALDIGVAMGRRLLVPHNTMLREVDYPIERSDEGMAAFPGLASNYDATALLLAKQHDTPPAPWTGTRR
jgi:hypothetical protein